MKPEDGNFCVCVEGEKKKKKINNKVTLKRPNAVGLLNYSRVLIQGDGG